LLALSFYVPSMSGIQNFTHAETGATMTPGKVAGNPVADVWCYLFQVSGFYTLLPGVVFSGMMDYGAQRPTRRIAK
jgi:hypothetical protein